MTCPNVNICGGCILRHKDIESYRQDKFAQVQSVLSSLPQPLPWGEPIYIADGTRRRASMAFSYEHNKLSVGFNQKASNNLINIDNCLLLTPRLNSVLIKIRELLQELCLIPYKTKKGKKTILQNISKGDIWFCDVANGVDVTLEYDAPLELNHRMLICEFINQAPDIIRISHRRHNRDFPEPIVEKSKPFINIGSYKVYIPSGTFLQPSQEGESALIRLVKDYCGDSSGKIFDLFCGVGTFSYALAEVKPSSQIIAVDSSKELLQGFQETINQNRITNIKIKEQNLFKYPVDHQELKGVDVVVFDPPRAGATTQVKMLSTLPEQDKPQKIIAISCHPATFVNDAKVLISSGYVLQKINFVDQFIYSNHSELVAVFTKS